VSNEVNCFFRAVGKKCQQIRVWALDARKNV
jgi:hypothetical protein